MSNLQKLLEKLSGRIDEPTEQVEDQDKYTDPVYVEKLAAAVDFIIDQSKEALEKQANMAKIQANLAKGMSPEAAVKAAYPEMSDEEVAALAAKIKASLGTASKPAETKEAPKEQPTEEEKTSSINTDILRSLLSGRPKTASVVDVEDSVDDVEVLQDNNEPIISVDKLRDRLREKLASTASSSSVGDFNVIDSVMSRLRELTSEEKVTSTDPAEVVEEATVAADTSPADTETVSTEETAGAVVEDSAKTASTKLTLAEMLKAATSDNAESTDESAPFEGVKTAEDQGLSVSTFLRNSIRRKIGQVEV